jgi:hypothetical protein
MNFSREVYFMTKSELVEKTLNFEKIPYIPVSCLSTTKGWKKRPELTLKGFGKFGYKSIKDL